MQELHNATVYAQITQSLPSPANQTVTILYKRLYNSYKVVTFYQLVQPVQPVQ